MQEKKTETKPWTGKFISEDYIHVVAEREDFLIIAIAAEQAYQLSLCALQLSRIADALVTLAGCVKPPQ